ncbi:hypothetical protein LguiA_013533 [Lonicera macranthoides]
MNICYQNRLSSTMNICYQNRVPSRIPKPHLPRKRFGINVISCQIGGRNVGFEVPSNITIRGLLALLIGSVDCNDKRGMISLGMGDPTLHSCFQTTYVAEEAVVDSLSSHNFNGYSPAPGLPQTRKAIAEYLSGNLPYKLSSDDVYVTAGCTSSIEIALSILAKPGANILLPRPGFPAYELCAAFRNIEVRHFDLVPQNGWEVDLNSVETLIDHNTVAIVIINPGNPCGNVYTYAHLKKIAEVAGRHKIVVISDEIYGHLAFGDKPFVPMGVFGNIVPILTLGSLSKRWLVPGWRLGWFVTTDLTGSFKNPKIVKRLENYFEIVGGPATFVQVKLNLSKLKDIRDDVDFCFKLAKEESVIILPGFVVGLKNWIRITFAVEPSCLEEAMERIKSFSERHSNQENVVMDETEQSNKLCTILPSGTAILGQTEVEISQKYESSGLQKINQEQAKKHANAKSWKFPDS